MSGNDVKFSLTVYLRVGIKISSIVMGKMIATTRSFVVLKLIEIRFACKLLLLLRRVGCMFSFIKNTHAALGVVYVRVLYAGCVMKKS